MHISTPVPKGVLYTVGMSMLSSVSGLHPICTMRTVPNHKVPAYAHWPLEAPSCLVGALTMCPPPPINLWQHSTLHPHLHAHSEPSCTATFGRAHPSMFPFAWRTFHHKPALVAPIILWLEYFLCAHHTNFPKFQLLGTHVDLHRPAFLPTWPFMACTPPCAPFHTPLRTSVHLCPPLHTFTHPSAHLCPPPCISMHL